jgi:hypothetical protein
MIQQNSTTAISGATIDVGTHYLLTASDVFGDTETVIINGVTFTSVTSIGTTAGNFLIGASKEDSLANLAGLINNPRTTSSTQRALSDVDSNTILNLGLTATVSGAVMTITSSKVPFLTVSETETNVAWSNYTYSKPVVLGAMGKTSIQFIAASVSSGNGVYTVEVSNDGTNWTAYNRLTTNVTNTNSQTDLRASSVTLNATGTAVVSIPDAFVFLRIKVVPTTDGTYSAVVVTA